MPRRRMIDPDFWDDSRVKALSVPERLFLVGMISHADDKGRLLADPAYLRSKIFPYDDFTLEEIKTMRDHIIEANPNVQLYINNGEEYIAFRKWTRYQKPSHPQPSKLPEPPKLQEAVQEQNQEPVQEQDQPQTRTIPSQVRSGQSSLGKVRLGKVRAVQEDFTEFLHSEKDLTDFVTTTLTEYMPRGPTQVMPVIQKLWLQAGREMSKDVFQVVYSSLQKYPIPVLAKSLVKAVKYSPGKTKPANYIQTVFKEQMKEYEKERPP
ncbi:unnamed protein product [marine sediment metagenome]|uniref:DnaD domain-containing protein n=1 Tax=marine sediment metagenome TaxID=412755 RepID=X1QAW7_9ZZZZ